MIGNYERFMNGEPMFKKPNRYEIANTFSKGCYHKAYEDLTAGEKSELIRWLSENSPLFR